MENGNTNWGQSVCGVVIRAGRVLLARHTYGSGKGRFYRSRGLCGVRGGAAGRDGAGGF